MQTQTLTPSDRSALRKALIQSGTPTRGMDDSALIVAYKALDPEPAALAPTMLDEPEPAREPTNGASAPQAPVAPPQTPVTPANGTDVAAAITAAIQGALASYAPPAPAIDESTIVRLIKEHATVTHNVTVERPDAPAVTIENAHAALPRVLAVIRAQQHCLMVGPAGSGKSTIAEHVATSLDLAFRSTGAVHQKYELTGFVDAHGNYQSTPLYDTVVNGGVFLWDEIDASAAPALVAFNQLLANKKMSFPGVGMVECHKDAIFIAAANTHGTGATRSYVGRTALDGATLDRYVEIEVGYDTGLEDTLASAAYKRLGGTDRDLLTRWLNLVRSVRSAALERAWPVVISPRASIAGASLLALDESFTHVANATLYRHLSADQRQQIGAAR